MKKIIILCLLCLSVVGCRNQKKTVISNENEKPQLISTDDSWGIELYVEKASNTSLTLVCSQHGGEITGELQTGEKYWIEKWEDEKWVELQTPEKPVWESTALSIKTEDLTSWNINWQDLYGELSQGQYRIGKEIDDLREAADYDEKTYYAEFTIQ